MSEDLWMESICRVPSSPVHYPNLYLIHRTLGILGTKDRICYENDLRALVAFLWKHLNDRKNNSSSRGNLICYPPPPENPACLKQIRDGTCNACPCRHNEIRILKTVKFVTKKKKKRKCVECFSPVCDFVKRKKADFILTNDLATWVRLMASVCAGREPEMVTWCRMHTDRHEGKLPMRQNQNGPRHYVLSKSHSCPSSCLKKYASHKQIKSGFKKGKTPDWMI